MCRAHTKNPICYLPLLDRFDIPMKNSCSSLLTFIFSSKMAFTHHGTIWNLIKYSQISAGRTTRMGLECKSLIYPLDCIETRDLCIDDFLDMLDCICDMQGSQHLMGIHQEMCESLSVCACRQRRDWWVFAMFLKSKP